MRVEVDDILSPAFPGVVWKTRLWASDAVRDAIADFSEKRERTPGYFVGKLRYYAETGFELWIGDEKPIRREWGGVYRIGQRNSLFRVIGIFENNTRKDFIALDAYLKRGHKLGSRDKKRIDAVTKIRADSTWRRKEC